MVRGVSVLQVAIAGLWAGFLWAQDLASASAPSDSAREAPSAQTATEQTSAQDGAAAGGADRTRLNLLGQVDAAAGEARRNENVKITLIDNNVLKDLNQRFGATATIFREFDSELNYFGKVFGGSPEGGIHVAPIRQRDWHGELFWTHNNSVFSARSFFQVGAVQPARDNQYGFDITAPLWRGATVNLAGGGRRFRGQVNGNVLVPAADERTPLATDPAVRRMVQRILDGYPKQLPNRTDIHPRALNTNAPQNINDDRGSATLDQAWKERDRVVARYRFTSQKVEAFQLVSGQNPDTTTRNHLARFTWTRSWSPGLSTDFSLGFERIGSLLLPDETSLGPFFLFSRELESLGPSSEIPIDRVQNLFQYAARSRWVKGRHELSFGGLLTRRQINGYESNNHRGTFAFSSDFGRDLITNLRLGTPSTYYQAIGDAYRGFRDWFGLLYFGDRWRATAHLSLDFSLRWEPATRPSVIRRLSEIPYDSDWNNLAPRFGLAYRLPGGWGTWRAAYGLHYGQIFPATFMQARFNPPEMITVSVQAPDLLEPLRGLDLSSLERNPRSSVYRLDPELATPYEHLYLFSWQIQPGRDWNLELGYVGSRSHKLLTCWWLNRARPVEGIPLLTETVDQRRPDPRYYDVRWILNGSRGYYDAAKLTLEVPRWAGLSLTASYWFSKALDIGADYTGTASGKDARMSRSPTEFDYQKAMKGLSDFDQTHSFQFRAIYQTPRLARQHGWLRALLGSWQLSSVLVLKSGTPFMVDTGSDSPAWGNVDGVRGDRPVLLDPSILGRSIDHPDTSVQRLPRSAFAPMSAGQARGSLVGRNTFRKDGIANVNAALSKRWSFGQDQTLVLRVESLNFGNHPQFDAPGFSLSAPEFGQITNTLNDGRTFLITLQLGF